MNSLDLVSDAEQKKEEKNQISLKWDESGITPDRVL